MPGTEVRHFWLQFLDCISLWFMSGWQKYKNRWKVWLSLVQIKWKKCITNIQVKHTKHCQLHLDYHPLSNDLHFLLYLKTTLLLPRKTILWASEQFPFILQSDCFSCLVSTENSRSSNKFPLLALKTLNKCSPYNTLDKQVTHHQ